MADQYDYLTKGFASSIDRYPVSVVGRLTEEQAFRSGQRAAAYAVAPALWHLAVGDSFETSDVMSLLDVTRQAVSKRLATGSLVGIRAGGTTRFPAWQFDMGTRTIRPVVREIIAAFGDELDTVDPYIIVSWASTPQHEDLAGQTPAEWVAKARDPATAVEAARRAANRLSS